MSEELEPKARIPYSSNKDREQDEKLLQPLAHILQVPGKKVRAALIKAFNYWMKVPDDKMSLIEEVVQLLHNASLLAKKNTSRIRGTMHYIVAWHENPKDIINMFPDCFELDDIQDDSVLRRGVPVAHSIYSIASTINAANYATFIALERLWKFEEINVIKIYTEQILEAYRGQGMDIYWRENFICPTEVEYRQMIKRKTGALFMLSIKLMQVFSNNKSNFSKLMETLGLYFQIQDDYINLCSADFMKNKSHCEDLTEGKFSFPIIHAIQTRPKDSEILSILRQRTENIEVKKYCVSLLEKYGSFEYTRSVLEELKKQARQEMKSLGENPLMEDLLKTVFNVYKY